jgi:hypothetical protein
MNPINLNLPLTNQYNQLIKKEDKEVVEDVEDVEVAEDAERSKINLLL